jgi:opacity protein-like surface antigen
MWLRRNGAKELAMSNPRKTSIVGAVLSAALVLAMPSLPALAQEQPAPGPTPPPDVKRPGGGGFYFMFDFSLGDSKNPDTDADFSVDLDWSTSFGFGLGYGMGPVRLEAEVNSHFYRVGSLDLGAVSPFPDADYAGAMRTSNLMANLYFDLPTAGNMRPFLGAGYGVAWVEAEYNESFCIIYCFSTSNTVVDDSDRTHAWQAMAGATFGRIGEIGEWYMGYRYYETGDLDFTTLSGVSFRQDGIKDHALLAGFRFFMN